MSDSKLEASWPTIVIDDSEQLTKFKLSHKRKVEAEAEEEEAKEEEVRIPKQTKVVPTKSDIKEAQAVVESLKEKSKESKRKTLSSDGNGSVAQLPTLEYLTRMTRKAGNRLIVDPSCSVVLITGHGGVSMRQIISNGSSPPESKKAKDDDEVDELCRLFNQTFKRVIDKKVNKMKKKDIDKALSVLRELSEDDASSVNADVIHGMVLMYIAQHPNKATR